MKSRVLRSLSQQPAQTAGAILVIGFVLFSLFGPMLTPYGATEQVFADARQGPSANHWLGTDHLGRDVFTRIAYGTRSILGLTGLGSLLAIAVGTVLGLVSGYRGGLFDEWLMRTFDSLLAIPALLLALVLLGTVGPSRSSVLIVIAVVYTPIVARVVRSEVLSIKTRGFVEAARLQGESTLRILFREILPSVLPSLSVEAALRFSYAIFLVASLGFLGVGVQPPNPDWGLMVKEARIYIRLAPWSLYAPAAAISLLIIGVNLTADGLKRALRVDPERLSIRARRSVGQAQEACPQEAPHIETHPPILRLADVTVSYMSDGRWLDAVRDVSFAIDPGETLGLVGESGSGKSTLALAIVRYLSANGAIRAGSLCFEGQRLERMDERDLEKIRGRQISLIPQDPIASLNPTIRVGEQIAEVLRLHRRLTHAEAARQAVEWLRRVRLADAASVARSYPHQLSGGMQQRVVIAMGLATEPRLAILDEPTTGLDVTTEAAILRLLSDLLSSGDHASLYISHDLGVVSRVASRVAVMYAGELVELAETEALFEAPAHPYTMGLLRSIPRIRVGRRREPLPSLDGAIPALTEIPSGCVFAPRCSWAVEICRDRPALDAGERVVRCHRWTEIRPEAVWQESTSKQTSADTAQPSGSSSPAVLRTRGVARRFRRDRSLGDRLRGRSPAVIRAVDGVDLELIQGQTLGLVGESGSGKTTLARAILGLEPRDDGDIHLKERLLSVSLHQRSTADLRSLQVVPQHPDSALNPYATVRTSLSRPLIRLSGRSRQQSRDEVPRLLEQVGLPPGAADRVPSQLSGGEKQRVAIARAFAARPDIVVCDEATSSLDVSVQALILNLLTDLQRAGGSAYLFITHDLSVVAHIADAIAVMYLGVVCEIGQTERVLRPPYHPYTEALLASFPAIGRRTPWGDGLGGEVPSGTDVPKGCRFHPRCARVLGPVCRTTLPPIRRSDDGHAILCHIPRADLATLQEPWFAESEDA